MTAKEYYVRGSTALVDAIGSAVHHIGSIHRYSRQEDLPANTLFIITTDGMENASHQFSADEVRKMIKYHKENDGWGILFVGANIDAVETARSFAIDPNRAVNYHADPKGQAILFMAMSETSTSVRCDFSIPGNWSAPISVDYQNRKKKTRKGRTVNAARPF